MIHLSRTLLAVVCLCFCARADAAMLYASVYWEDRYVSSGARFNPDGMTAASTTLPRGTKITVSFHRAQVVVTINDDGPHIRGRQIDLARGAAKAIHFYPEPALGKVKVEYWPPLPRPRPQDIP